MAKINMVPNKDKSKVLCTLRGPLAIADAITRNGTNYTTATYDAIENSDNFQEMKENGSFYIGIDHPDEAQISSLSSIYTRTAGIVSSYERKPNGIIEVDVDVLDTPSGRIIDTLARYGSKIGISTRAYGDLLEGGVIDPETIDFLGADFVTQPSQIKSRLSMVLTESRGNNTKVNKESLQETLKVGESLHIEKRILTNMKTDLNKLKEDKNMRKLQEIAKLAKLRAVTSHQIINEGKQVLDKKTGQLCDVVKTIQEGKRINLMMRDGKVAIFESSNTRSATKIIEALTSVGSDPQITVRVPRKKPDIDVDMDNKFVYSIDQIKEIIPQLKDFGKVTLKPDGGITIESFNKKASVTVKEGRILAYQGRTFMESARLEKDDNLVKCIKEVLSDYE